MLRALREMEADPQRTLVIGDSPADIVMGQRAGTLTAAALWGGSSRDRLMAEAPDFALASPADLIEVLSEASRQ